MLVLSRKPTEKVTIADDITITVLSVQGNRVRLGIEAPGEYRVLRAELSEWSDSPAKELVGSRYPQRRDLAVAAADNDGGWRL